MLQVGGVDEDLPARPLADVASVVAVSKDKWTTSVKIFHGPGLTSHVLLLQARTGRHNVSNDLSPSMSDVASVVAASKDRWTQSQ